MSEEMKLILALIDHLNLQAVCSGQGVRDMPVEKVRFEVDNPEYEYKLIPQ